VWESLSRRRKQLIIAMIVLLTGFVLSYVFNNALYAFASPIVWFFIALVWWVRDWVHGNKRA